MNQLDPLWATTHKAIQGLTMFPNQKMRWVLSRNVHRLWTTAAPRKKKHSIWSIVSSSRTFENTNIKSIKSIKSTVKINKNKHPRIHPPQNSPQQIKKAYTKTPWHCPPGHRFPLDLAIFGLKARPSTSPRCHRRFQGWDSTFWGWGIPI